MKTPEQLAEEYAFAATKHKSKHGYYYWIVEEVDIIETAFLAGYKAAQQVYEAKIEELETQLENWQHNAVHGDEGL